jgi:hypothetical protein
MDRHIFRFRILLALRRKETVYPTPSPYRTVNESLYYPSTRNIVMLLLTKPFSSFLGVAASLLGCALVIVIEPAAAWGKDGHEIVGNLAWRLISNATAAHVKNILRRDDGSYGDDDESSSPLGSVADWADKARYSQAFHWSAPLHYIDVHDDAITGGCPVQNRTGFDPSTETFSCQFDYARDCANDWCVAGAIANFTNQLPIGLVGANATATASPDSDELLRESLKFLVHFVGDIHQPLHASRASDRGGNTIDVHFNRSSGAEADSSSMKSLSGRDYQEYSRRNLRHSHHHSSNLHSVWDDSIIKESMHVDYHGSRQSMEEALFQFILDTQNTDEWKAWMACPNGGDRACTSLWGEESLDYALTWAYANVDGTPVREGDELSGEYYETRLPVVKERLAVAAVRLAVTLEMNLAGQERDSVAVV